MIRKLVSAAVMVALAAVACGGDSGGAPSDSIRVVTVDFQYSPSVWRVPAGQEIPISMINEGAVAHEWIIMGQPIASADEYSPENSIFTTTVEVDSTSDAVIPPLEVGEYQVICSIPGHFGSGMKGTLSVAAP